MQDYTEFLEELLEKCLPYVEGDAKLFKDSETLAESLKEVISNKVIMRIV